MKKREVVIQDLCTLDEKFRYQPTPIFIRFLFNSLNSQTVTAPSA